jgi:hypothetical protein
MDWQAIIILLDLEMSGSRLVTSEWAEKGHPNQNIKILFSSSKDFPPNYIKRLQRKMKFIF